MDAPALLALYDATMRADPPSAVGVADAWAGPVLRRSGVGDMIEYWSFQAADTVEAVVAEAAHARGRGRSLAWKVFSHDGPGNLQTALAEAGFNPQPAETFMAFDLTAPFDAGDGRAAISLRRVVDAGGLADVVALHAAAFGVASPALAAELAERLTDPTLAIYVAWVDGRPRACGRLEAPPGRPFAGLYGGGVEPGWRGRGLYRALVSVRAEEARRRGARYLTVDAAPTSRPTLERIGFKAVASVRDWVLSV